MSPICTLSTCVLIGLVPNCVLVQAPFIVWVEPTVRALDCEWLVVYLSQKYPSGPICRMGSCFISQDFFGVTEVGGSRSPLLGTCESLDPHLGLHLNHYLKRRKSQRTSSAAFGVIFITSVIARQANLCTLLSSVLLWLCLTLGHQTCES